MPPRISLDQNQLDELKRKWTRERPYSSRVSAALAFRLVTQQVPPLDPFSILAEMDYLEGLRTTSLTKPEQQFRHPPLFPFWHKHFYSARHIVTNLKIRWGLNNGGNRDFNNLIKNIARDHGHDPESWPRHLAHQMTVDAFNDRTKRGLTGDWIIYAEHNGEKYYLDIASHAEGQGHQAVHLMKKLERGSQAEFPFLF